MSERDPEFIKQFEGGESIINIVAKNSGINRDSVSNEALDETRSKVFKAVTEGELEVVELPDETIGFRPISS